MNRSGGNLAYEMVQSVHYQLERTLIALAEDPKAIAVAPEWGDDYTLFSGLIDPTAQIDNLEDLRRLPGVTADVAQVTRRSSGGAGILGNTSEKLIQSLANWLIEGIKDPVTCGQAGLPFIVNQKVKPINWVARLSAVNRDARRDGRDVSDQLKELLRELEANYRKNGIPKNARRWFDRFFVEPVGTHLITNEDRIQLLSRVQLRDGKIDGGVSLLRVMNLHPSIPADEYNEAMFGWFAMRCVNSWRRGAVALISKDDLAAASRNTSGRFESRKARERPAQEVLNVAATPEALQAAKMKPFMRLLGEIGITADSPMGLDQIRHYLCFGEERARLAAENVFLGPFLASLRDRWKAFYNNSTTFADPPVEPVGAVTARSSSVKVGREIFRATLNPDYHPELEGRSTSEGYMRDGAYQHLADRFEDQPREAVWWLPDPRRDGNLVEPIGGWPVAEDPTGPDGGDDGDSD